MTFLEEMLSKLWVFQYTLESLMNLIFSNKLNKRLNIFTRKQKTFSIQIESEKTMLLNIIIIIILQYFRSSWKNFKIKNFIQNFLTSVSKNIRNWHFHLKTLETPEGIKAYRLYRLYEKAIKPCHSRLREWGFRMEDEIKKEKILS